MYIWISDNVYINKKKEYERYREEFVTKVHLYIYVAYRMYYL